MAERSQSDNALVHLSERLTNSAAFSNLFREGMDLVEETAAYLDGDGRTEAKALERSVSSSSDSNDRSWPISWLIFFRGRSSSSIAIALSLCALPNVHSRMCSPQCAVLAVASRGMAG